MNSTSVITRAARRWLALFVVALGLGTLPSVRAQVFLNEITDDDIGRIGPTGSAIDTVGGVTYLYVSDQNNGRIIKYNLATGARVAAWGTNGNGQLQFNSPYGIAIDPVSHDLYIAERGNNRIQRITNQGVFVHMWGTHGTGNGFFDGPLGIAADASGNVYVTDHNNNRIQKFRVTGGTTVNHLITWGGGGTAAGQLNGPYGITLDASNTLWVADAFNHRLQRFDVNGNLVAVVGSQGSGNGQFITPTWVTFDATGAYYVCETNSDPQIGSTSDIQQQRIQKFTSTGTFVTKWGSYGEAGGQFRLPFTIAVDANGFGYVSDYYNTRLQKFNLSAVPAQTAPVINSSTGASGAVGSAFLYLTTSLAFPAATSYSATALPGGLTMNPVSGAITGNAAVGGNFNATITATNSVGSGTKALAISISGATGVPTITSATTASATVGVNFSYTITATNNPTSFGAVGLPPGVTFNATTGVISGVPTAAGPYSPVITATNSFGNGQATLALTVSNTGGGGTGNTLPPQTVAVGGTATFTAQVTGAATFQWQYNGVNIAGATNTTYAVANAQSSNAGIYTVTINGTTTQSGLLGITTGAKVVGNASEIGTDIVHQNGNVYDQILLNGPAATFTADAGQITRLSYVDINDDIVQVEFNGAGSVSIVLDGATGPAAPLKYNQPGVSYMKGHANIVVVGANQTTNLTIFTVGRSTAVNQSLFISGVSYNGVADIGSVSLASTNGQFNGLRTANATYLNTRNLTGVFAPGVTINGPLFMGDITASAAATPVILIGSGATTQINGGDLFQINGRAVQVSGLTQLRFVAGGDSHGNGFPAQMCQGRLEQDGVDVTTAIVVNPN